MVTTEPVEVTAKLKHQITQLRAALTKAGSGKGHPSTLSSPKEDGHGCGYSREGSSSHLDSHNGRGGPSQMTQANSLSDRMCGRRCKDEEAARELRTWCQGRGCSWQQRATLSPVLQMPKMGPHDQGVPYPGIYFKPA